ncbi:MAG TPA: NADH-quinone oxidoreductase subunit J [Candidatus Polarisedimenticolia bacterium]|nr:NADH-quinone oxidoreductase subunit J [Candidatus Polarisedimenticolia bacterium]
MQLLSELVIVVMAVALARALVPERPLLPTLGGGLAAIVLLVWHWRDLLGLDFWAGAVGFVAILSALLVVLHPNPMVSVLFLILNLLCVALFYLMLQAHLLAALQVIVYAGAIMVLFVFVIMLLNLKSEEGLRLGRGKQRWPAHLLGIGFAAILFWVLRHRGEMAWAESPRYLEGFGTARDMGELLFTDFVFATEMASILLVAAMVGAVILAKRRLD